MTFTATWDPTQARVVLAASAIPAGITTVRIERFDNAAVTNGTTVRGSTLDGADPGTSFTLSDREFTPGVLNTYKLYSYTGASLTSTQTATVTPALDVVWLRSIARPFLDRPVTVVGFGSVVNPSRGGTLEVLGRRKAVAITEVRGARQYEVTLRAADRAEVDALELFFSFGDVVLLQVPEGCVLPASVYAFVGDVSFTRAGRHDSEARYVTVPLQEVDAPDDNIVGYTITYAGVLAAWASYTAMMAANATYAALMAYVSAPADEVVG